MHKNHVFIIRRLLLLLHLVHDPSDVINLFFDFLRRVQSLEEPLSHLVEYAFLIPIQPKLHAGCLSHSLHKQGVTFLKHFEFSFRILNREDTVDVRILSLSELDKVVNETGEAVEVDRFDSILELIDFDPGLVCRAHDSHSYFHLFIEAVPASLHKKDVRYITQALVGNHWPFHEYPQVLHHHVLPYLWRYLLFEFDIEIPRCLTIRFVISVSPSLFLFT